jgi:hypothetical protein
MGHPAVERFGCGILSEAQDRRPSMQARRPARAISKKRRVRMRRKAKASVRFRECGLGVARV